MRSDGFLQAFQTIWHRLTGRARAQAEAELRDQMQRWVFRELSDTLPFGQMSLEAQSQFQAALMRNWQEALAIFESPRLNRRKVRALLRIVLTDTDFFRFRESSAPGYWRHAARIYGLGEDISPSSRMPASDRPPTLQEMTPHCPGKAGKRITQAAAAWIFPELARQLEGLTRTEMISLYGCWQDTGEATRAILESGRNRQAMLTELLVIALEHWYKQRGFGPEYADLSERIVDAFPIQERLSDWRKCQYCGLILPDKLMKNHSRCWDCWGG